MGQKALANHPDKFFGAEKELAEARFKEIAHAHDVLSDPHKRWQYDMELQHDHCRGEVWDDAFFFGMCEAQVRFCMPREESTHNIWDEVRFCMPRKESTHDVWDGIYGLGFLSVFVVTLWALQPIFRRCGTWFYCQWRFLQYDLDRWLAAR